MRNLAIVTVASLMIGSAYAMPAENANGAHSYSYQGKAVSVKVVSHNRNIPAPSSWTPPERIPSPRVTMVQRYRTARVSGGNGFSNPGFTNPSLSSPTFSNPSLTSPGFTNPGFTNPSLTSPGFSNPSLSSPGFTSPALSSPRYSNPSSSL